MARKKKKETEKISSEKMDAWLVKTENRISNVQYGKDFENLKQVLIKLLSKIKKEPNLLIFEPRLVLLLKDCNLNLQFIRRNEDCWILLKSGHSKEALEEIIHTLKDLNAHPDKYLIRPDIKGKIIESIKKISENVESEVKILPHLNLPDSNIKTLNPSTSEQILSHSTRTTGNTFKPKLENFNPFDISGPRENPFKFIDDEKLIQKEEGANSKTYFQPKEQNLEKNELETDLGPFSNQDNVQNLSEDQMNSIDAYWSKEEIRIKKKKKSDNPWPDPL